MGNCLPCQRRGDLRRSRGRRGRNRINPNHTVADSSNIHINLSSDRVSYSGSTSSVLSDSQKIPSPKDVEITTIAVFGKNKVSLVFEYIKKDEYNPELEAALKSLTATLDTNNYIQGPTGHDIAPKEDSCLQKQELEQSTNTDITTEVLRKKTKRAKRQAIREASIEAELAPTSTKNTKEIKSGPTGHDIAPKEDFCLQKQELEQSTNTDITTEVLRKKTKGAKRQAVREVSIEAELAPTSTKNTKEIKSGPTGHDIAPKEDFCLQKQELEQSTNTDITTEVLRKKTKRAKRQAIREASIEAELAPTSTKNTKEIKSGPTGHDIAPKEDSCLQKQELEQSTNTDITTEVLRNKTKRAKRQAIREASIEAELAPTSTKNTKEIKSGQSTNNAEKQNDTMTKDCLGLHQLELVDETNATIVKRQKLLEKKLKRSKSLAHRNAIGSAVPTTSNTNTEEVKQVDLQLSKQELVQSTNTDITTEVPKKKTKRAKRQAIREPSIEAELAPTSTKNTEEIKPVETQISGPSTLENKALRDGIIIRGNSCLQNKERGNKTSETNVRKEKLHKKKLKKPKPLSKSNTVDLVVATRSSEEIIDVDTKPSGQSTNNAEKQNNTMAKDCLGLHQLELVDETNATNVKREKLLEKKLKRSKPLDQRNAIGSAVPTTSTTKTEEVKQVDLQLSGLYTQEEEDLMNDIMANEDLPHGSRN